MSRDALPFAFAAAALLACSSGDQPGAHPDAGGGHAGAAMGTGTGAAGMPAHDAGGGGAGQGGAGGQTGFVPAAHALFPSVMNGGGGVISPMRVVSVVAAGDPETAALEGFADAVVKSSWYGTMGADYGVGPAGPSAHLAGHALAVGSMTLASDASVAQYLAEAIQAGAPALRPDGKTLYVIFAPVGVPIKHPSQCPVSNAGYHRGYLSGGDSVAVVERCAMQDLDKLTITTSHEIAEAATNTGPGWALRLPANAQPWSVSPWVDCEGKGTCEVGDLCTLGARVAEGAYTYQRIFSNSAAAKGGDPCVPTLPIPYFNVSTVDLQKGWYAGKAGAKVSIPIVGWSTAETADWLLAAAQFTASDPTTVVAVALAGLPVTEVAGRSYSRINNARAGALEVTLPNAPAGFWAILAIESRRLDASGQTPAGQDFFHRWEVGVRVE